MLTRRAATWIALALLSASSLIGACESKSTEDTPGQPGSDAGADALPEAAFDAADGHVEAAVPFDIDPQRIRADIAVLTSDEFEGRLPGTPGGEKALAHVE